MKESKQDLRDEIKKLKTESVKRDENQKLLFTKKELQDFIKKEIEENLIVEVKEHDSYQYGGGYKTSKSIGVFWGDTSVYESTSFE